MTANVCFGFTTIYEVFIERSVSYKKAREDYYKEIAQIKQVKTSKFFPIFSKLIPESLFNYEWNTDLFVHEPVDFRVARVRPGNRLSTDKLAESAKELLEDIKKETGVTIEFYLLSNMPDTEDDMIITVAGVKKVPTKGYETDATLHPSNQEKNALGIMHSIMGHKDRPASYIMGMWPLY